MYTKYAFDLFNCILLKIVEKIQLLITIFFFLEKGVRLQTTQKPIIGGRSMSQEDHSSDEHHTAHTTSSHHSLAHSVHSHPTLRYVF